VRDADTTADGSARLLRLSRVAVLTYTVVDPALGVATVLLADTGFPLSAAGPAVLSIALAAALTAAALRAPLRRCGLVLLGITVALAGAAVAQLHGLGWSFLYVPAALVAVALPVGWAVGLVVVLTAVAGPLALTVGDPDYALYFTMGVPVAIVPLIVAVRLVRTVHEVRAARAELARDAVVRERLRIDRELAETVGAALADVVARGELAQQALRDDVPGVREELRGLSATSRRCLAGARRLVRGYREGPLRDQVRTAHRLLAAAGVADQVEPGPADDAAARAALRTQVARLLGGADPAGTNR
jgi:signal transduction histidine kinase